MDQKERLRAEKLLNKLTPYIEVKDYGALLCAIHNQIEYQHKQLNLPVVSISKAKEYTEFIIIADRKSLPLISLDDYIKRY